MDSTLVVKVLAKATDKLELLVNAETVDSGFHNITDGSLINSDEAVVVHEGEESHDELAIHAISDTTVARDRLAKVLDVEGALQTRGKESTERSNERGEGREAEDVELHGLNVESLVEAEHFEREWLRDESGVEGAFQAGQNIGSEIIDGADEVLVAHQDVGHEVAEDNSANPCAEETFNGLLGGKLDQLGATKGDTADVGEDIVGNDQRGGKEEPDHALEDVVHDEVGLDHNQIQCHVCPSKLGELESVVALLERSDKEHESYRNQLAYANTKMKKQGVVSICPLTHDVESKANESVVRGQREQHLVDEEDVLEVVDDTLSVQEIHCCREEIPIQGLGEAEVLLLAGDVGDGNDFLEGDNLDRGDQTNDIDVTGEHGDEKAGDHHESPYRAGNEGLLLFLVFGLNGFLIEFIRRAVRNIIE